MARISSSQVPSESIDASGVSVTISPRRSSDPRYGSLYDTIGLAGAAPVHLHRLTSEQYLLVFSHRWHSATVSSENPGGYLDFVEDTAPGWVRVAVPTGRRTMIGDSFVIPGLTGMLVDAVSRASEYLYLLTSDGSVSHWWQNTNTGSVTKVADEIIPGGLSRPDEVTSRAWLTLSADERAALGDAVVFNCGLLFLSPYLVAFGASAADRRVFMSRKTWGRIGKNSSESWSYWTGDGWSTDSSLVAPLVDSTGQYIVSDGPVSVVSYRDQSWMSVVIADGPTRFALVYTQRGQRPWTPTSTLIYLGSTADGSYIEGGLRFQQQVPPVAEAMTDCDAALVYVVTTRSTAAGVSTLENTWGLLSVASRVASVDALGLDAHLSASVALFAGVATPGAGVDNA